MTAADALTLDQILALHPWPPDHAGERRLEWLWSFDVPLHAEDLWRVVADSSRVNRSLGVSEMKFEERGGVRWGTSSPGGVRHEWIEVPWDWVAGQWLSSVRLYERGFSRVVYAVFVLTPAPSGERGTRLYTYFGAVPRGPLGALALRFGFPSLEKGFRALWSRVAEEIGKGEPPLVVASPVGLASDAETRLATIREGLLAKGLDRVCVERLVTWVRTGDEQDLHRIQVRERARAFEVDEDALLRVCLHATRSGMLELSWDVVCPHCRGVVGATAHLGGVTAHGECQVCGIDFGTDAAEAIEITFHVHPSIRDVPKRTYCSAEPATKSHIRVQRRVPAGAEVELSLELARGRYRLRLDGEKRYGYLDVRALAGAEVAWRASAGPSEHAVTEACVLRLVNDSARDRTFIVEQSQWTDVALRPGRLLSFQEFRDLFSTEYVGADVQLGIGEQTLLFTDIVGSTALYAQRGDPAAFVEVKRHFSEVFAIIANNRGAVVKTIGDAAMGAFNNPLDAVKASKQIHDCFHQARTDTPVRLRISLNTGPCIAVKLNADVDYFGHAVNIAAKLQTLAEAGHTAMSDAVWRAPGVAAWLEQQGAVLEDVVYASKAIAEPVAVKRWTVPAAPDRGA
jgi:class 3 adenylate cyclase